MPNAPKVGDGGSLSPRGDAPSRTRRAPWERAWARCVAWARDTGDDAEVRRGLLGGACCCRRRVISFRPLFGVIFVFPEIFAAKPDQWNNLLASVLLDASVQGTADPIKNSRSGLRCTSQQSQLPNS